jgi:SAM-dependent methyltransferase
VAGHLRRQYVKRCDPQDFEDPRVLAVLSDILPERDPRAFIERKAWEFAMLALYLDDAGMLTEDTQALAVGAGDERILFWLANRLRRVVATDIYGSGEFAENEASASMLSDPASHAPYPYRKDHLEVLWMDGRWLGFPDESFDVVFSVSSIEHFGGASDIARSAREMARVLRPGGHAVILTEAYVIKHWLNSAPVDFALRLASLGRLRRRATPRRRAGVDVLTVREIERYIVAASGLTLAQPYDLSLSPESWSNVATKHRDGRTQTATGEFWPHTMLRFRGSTWMSICLALQKSPRGQPRLTRHGPVRGKVPRPVAPFD